MNSPRFLRECDLQYVCGGSDPAPRWRFWLGVGLFLFYGLAYGGADLNPTHPESYTVKEGDTLWDIAGKFLQRPWQWPEIWRENRQIKNPHWIYPGDVLWLTEEGGRPVLQVGSPSELRLSPRVRSTPLESAIPAIPMNAVRQFLSQPRVVSAEEIAGAPYVVGFMDEHTVGGGGNRMLVRSILRNTGDAYTIVRPGRPYADAETGDSLGYEAAYVGNAQLEEVGDPATLMISLSQLEVRIGDRLLPVEPEPIQIAFQPHAPKREIKGHIISVVGGVTQIGQYSIVAIDRGAADGLEVGHVLAIWQSGKPLRDVVGPVSGEVIMTPAQRTGLLMIFRTYDRVSYGLVMQAARALHLFDAVSTP